MPGREFDSESVAFGPAGAIPSTKYQTPAQTTAMSMNALDQEDGVDWQRPGGPGAVSPGPGHTDGLESGVDDLGGKRTRSASKTVSSGMGRREAGTVSTMLQGSRELG